MTGRVVVSGPVLGALVARHPTTGPASSQRRRRDGGWCGRWCCAAGAGPGLAVVVLAFAYRLGGPVSMVGFDLARSFTPARRRAAPTAWSTSAGSSLRCPRWRLVGMVLDQDARRRHRVRAGRVPGGHRGAVRRSGRSARSRSCGTATRRSSTWRGCTPARSRPSSAASRWLTSASTNVRASEALLRAASGHAPRPPSPRRSRA